MALRESRNWAFGRGVRSASGVSSQGFRWNAPHKAMLASGTDGYQKEHYPCMPTSFSSAYKSLQKSYEVSKSVDIGA